MHIRKAVDILDTTNVQHAGFATAVTITQLFLQQAHQLDWLANFTVYYPVTENVEQSNCDLWPVSLLGSEKHRNERSGPYGTVCGSYVQVTS
jgi:hypothetical protein